ncbi:MAG: discoidin domain-containing protein, partial [Verrucomicrobia bacterium]|nr:discoidin domain-containing protein [Verrucomicrobiota bacterium]
QMRHSLLRYMNGDRFNPTVKLTAAQVQSLFAKPSAMQRLGARIVRADSEANNFPAMHILDGDPNTLWHTSWDAGAPEFPHEVVVSFEKPATLKGVELTPRQDMRNGWFKDFAIYVSDDGKRWGEPIARGTMKPEKNPQQIKLAKPAAGRFLKLVLLSTFDASKPFASLAELSVETE